MPNGHYSEFPARKASVGGDAPDPIRRGSATPKVGRVGTYARPTPKSSRTAPMLAGKRVKRSMVEEY